MYIQIGRPKALGDLRVPPLDMGQLKRRYQIAVVDDEPFAKANALRSHKFNIVETGDIKAADQVSEYAIVVCDVRGVGKALDSRLEGAHLLAEIRKAYPDKFLVSYSGAQFDMNYNLSLSKADVSVAKDAATEQWVEVLEKGLEQIGNPRQRWLRFRRTLLDRGVDLHEVFGLEQAFIKSIEKRNANYLIDRKVPDEIKEVVTTFAKIALVSIIESMVV